LLVKNRDKAEHLYSTRCRGQPDSWNVKTVRVVSLVLVEGRLEEVSFEMPIATLTEVFQMVGAAVW